VGEEQDDRTDASLAAAQLAAIEVRVLSAMSLPLAVEV